VSGQLINNGKSRFYTRAMSVVREQMLGDMLGFGVGSIPFTYLGCPMFKGNQSLSIFLQFQIKSK